MREQLEQEANRTYTENGAATYRTSRSDCLDLFSTIGALRRASDAEIAGRFSRAYAEDADLAMKILFFARDIRGGMGERRVFRILLRWLSANEPCSLAKNVRYIAEYGRYDDLLALLGTACEEEALACIRQQLDADRAAWSAGKPVSLLAKWLPSVNASHGETVRQAKRVARALGMNDAQYRKTLSALRARIDLLENRLRERDYTFAYAGQPSGAMFKYRRAFLRNDAERYTAFMKRVSEGEERLHTGPLTPYELIRPALTGGHVLSERERLALDATWRAQGDVACGANALAVIDGSGSMYGGPDPVPAAVALSLGIYCAERNTGAFHNRFITFSETPRLVEIKGRDIYEKVRYCCGFNEVANTNLQRVFALILQTAVKYRVPADEMPARLYIISDMEFDSCVEDRSATNFEQAQRLFSGYGYPLPEVVFWNVDSRRLQQPVTVSDTGVALVSGCSPRIFSMLQEGSLSPYGSMMEILTSDRYAPIVA